MRTSGRLPFRLLGLVLALALASSVAAQRRPGEPEPATHVAANTLAVAKKHMVVTANPYASQAGLEMLRQGGSAVDAAIAAQLVLNIVEPQSSGIGGGLFLLHFDAKANAVKAYDGRETAPSTAMADRFLLEGGRVRPFDEAVASGLSIGVPGALKALELAHRRHGKLPWAKLFEPAIKLAEEGFAVSPRLSLLLGWQGAESFAPSARAYFFDETGRPWPPGHLLRSPELAATLKLIAAQGADTFYKGPVAEKIIAAAKTAPRAPSDMTKDDLARYEAKEREPLCFAYRRHRICGMPPPSSGGLAVAQTLLLLEPFDLGTSALDARGVHLIAEAQKLAFADRNQFVADPDFVPLPSGLLDPAYIAARRSLISADKAQATPVKPGEPLQKAKLDFGLDETLEAAGTSHLSIVDAEGNAVAMTTTIESAFGARLMAAGFLLNNELTDFSFRPADAQGRAIANRVEGGKRPRSSMAPTLVFDELGKLKAVIGSPGGSRIILYVIKSAVALIDWRLDAQEAAALMNFGSQNGPLELEPGWRAAVLGYRLSWRGQEFRTTSMTSGIHVIVVANGRLEGGADPRREGAAVGD
jgi:gamma-glutamyltranspeptidase/glutathione hydrolase